MIVGRIVGRSESCLSADTPPNEHTTQPFDINNWDQEYVKKLQNSFAMLEEPFLFSKNILFSF